jgi:2-dehydropantoate 2-reductase
MKIAIMGSGGVGAYVGARLQAAGQQVSFIARGAHLHALQQQGLHIEMPQHPLHLPTVHATDDPAQVGPVDLIVFAVKLWDTEIAARALVPMVGPHTRILTLQNGIDSVELIQRHVGSAEVLGGVIYVSAVIDRPGVIKSPGGMNRIVMDSAQGDPVAAEFAAACAGATALQADLAADVGAVIWEKFVALASLSGATSLLRARMGAIVSHPEALAFLTQLVHEVVAVAQACGQPLRPELQQELIEKFQVLPPSFRSSMAEDLERGKPLELPWLSGRVHALGLQHAVRTPAHTAVYRGLVLYAAGQAV